MFPRHRGLAIPSCFTPLAWPLSDKKPMGFLSDNGHIRTMMHFSSGDWKDIFIVHVINIIKSEAPTFLIVIIFFRGRVSEMFVRSYSIKYCIYIPGKLGFCSHYYGAVYDECKYPDTLWPVDRIRLFVQYTISLSSLCKLICRHWTYEMSARYILSSVWARLSMFS